MRRLSSEAALDSIQVLVAAWLSNRRQSASDTVGEIAFILESTGRPSHTADHRQPAPSLPSQPGAGLRLVHDCGRSL